MAQAAMAGLTTRIVLHVDKRQGLIPPVAGFGARALSPEAPMNGSPSSGHENADAL